MHRRAGGRGGGLSRVRGRLGVIRIAESGAPALARVPTSGRDFDRRSRNMWVDVKALVGSGDRIALVMLPAVVVGAALEVADPSLFSVGGPPTALAALSIVVLAVGVWIWAWSVVLILSNV